MKFKHTFFTFALGLALSVVPALQNGLLLAQEVPEVPAVSQSAAVVPGSQAAPPSQPQGNGSSDTPKIRMDVFGGLTAIGLSMMQKEAVGKSLGWEAGANVRFLRRAPWFGVAGTVGHAWRQHAEGPRHSYVGIGPTVTSNYLYANDSVLRVFGSVMAERTFNMDSPGPPASPYRLKMSVGGDLALLRVEGVWRRTAGRNDFGVFGGIVLPICAGGSHENQCFRIF